MNTNQSTSDDLYATLQVAPNADPEVIRAAYERLTAKYSADPSPEVRERRRALDGAFAVLSNAGRRADYDARTGRTATLATAPAVAADAPRARGVVECPRDPGVETALRCSRCETPICPRCLVQTPVGARCKNCARVSHSPIYVLSGQHIVRAALASIIGGVIMGLIWGFILLPFTVGFLSIFIGAGLGYAFTRLLELATNRKRGPAVVAFAIVGIMIAWGMQFLFVPPRIALYGLVAVGVAIYFAYQKLRYV